MNAALYGQRLVLLILAGVVAWQLYAQIQEYAIRRHTRKMLKNLLESSPEGWAITHRQFLAERRTQHELRITRDALIDAVGEDLEGYGYHDNAADSPDPKRAA